MAFQADAFQTDAFQQRKLRVDLAAQLNGVWTSIDLDVIQDEGFAIVYGIAGAGPLDLVAQTGRMNFSLRNDGANSGGKVGYYSPGHANVRSGWKLGVKVRFVYQHPITFVTYYKFIGSLESVEPGAGHDKVVRCTVVDWMDEAAKFKPNVVTQVSKRADEVATALVAAVNRQPEATSFDVGDSTFPFALDNSESERQPVLTELQRLAQSEFGRFVIRGDTVTGGVLRFLDRTSFVVPEALAQFGSGTMEVLSTAQSRDLIINTCKATTHPRRVDAAATSVLFKLQGTPSVAAGASLTIEGGYSDPSNRAERVGGKDMVAPVATTDYTMNAQADGAGADLTADFIVAATYGANTVKYVITNNGGTLGFITKLEARGRGLYDYTPIEVPVSNATSITDYGENVVNLDMPYQDDLNTTLAVAQYIVDVWSSPAYVESSIEVLAVEGDKLTDVLRLEPGDAITVTETVTGVAQAYFIAQVSLSIGPGLFLRCRWLLQRTQIQNYWTLGVAGKSEIGTTTVVAPL